MKSNDVDEPFDCLVRQLAGEQPGIPRRDVENAVRQAAREIGAADDGERVSLAARRILNEARQTVPAVIVQAAFGAQSGSPPIGPGSAA